MRSLPASLLLILLIASASFAQAPVLVVEVEPGKLFAIDLETGMVRPVIYFKLEPPVPPPPPITQLYGFCIYESADRDDYDKAQPGINNVIDGERLQRLDQRFKWYPTEADEEAEPFRSWAAAAKEAKKPLPYLFLVQQEGKLVEDMPLPDTVDKVITEVRKYLP